MQPIITFFREARGELSKVAWPSKRDIIRNTIIVVVVSTAVAAFLGSLDAGLAFVLKTVLSWVGQ